MCILYYFMCPHTRSQAHAYTYTHTLKLCLLLFLISTLFLKFQTLVMVSIKPIAIWLASDNYGCALIVKDHNFVLSLVQQIVIVDTSPNHLSQCSWQLRLHFIKYFQHLSVPSHITSHLLFCQTMRHPEIKFLFVQIVKQNRINCWCMEARSVLSAITSLTILHQAFSSQQ